MCPKTRLPHNRQFYLFVWLLFPSIFAYKISRWRQGQGNALPPLPPCPRALPLSPTDQRPPALSSRRAGRGRPRPPSGTGFPRGPPAPQTALRGAAATGEERDVAQPLLACDVRSVRAAAVPARTAAGRAGCARAAGTPRHGLCPGRVVGTSAWPRGDSPVLHRVSTADDVDCIWPGAMGGTV